MRALAFEHLRPNPIGVYGDVLDARGIEVDRVMLDEGDAIPDWRAYDFLVVMGAAANVWDHDETSVDRGREGDDPRGRARGRPVLRRLLRRSAARVGLRRAQLPGDGGRARAQPGVPDRGGPSRPGVPRLPARPRRLRVALQPLRVAVRAPFGSHGRRATRTRRSGSAGSPTASNATSRRRARTSRLGSSCFRRPWACSSRGTAPDRCRPSSTTTARLCLACARPRDSSSDAGWRTRSRSATSPARAGALRTVVPRAVEPARKLIGRDSERARIESALAMARQGGSAVIVVRGEAGAGKTALLDDAVARARGLRVVRTRGADPEGEQPFAAVRGAVRAAARPAPRVPAARAAALASALGLGAPTRAVDRYAVYAGMLDLLTRRRRRRLRCWWSSTTRTCWTRRRPRRSRSSHGACGSTGSRC